MTPTTDRPAAELDPQLNTAGNGGRTQNPALACPRGDAARSLPGAPVPGREPSSSPAAVNRRHDATAAGDPSPAGGEHASRQREAADSSPPAGPSRGLRGAEWQAAAKAAQSKARRGRPGRSAAKPAAKVTIPPAPATGARLTATADCLGRCDWTAGPGDPAEVDKAAERHTTKPPKHPTNTVSVVAL